MLIFRMSDGFGNQLWVYGAAYHFSKLLGEEIAIDTSALDAPWYFRDFGLSHYDVRIDKRITYKFNDGRIDHLFWNHYHRRKAIGLFTKTIKEADTTVEALKCHLEKHRNLYLIGYWQDVDYIQDIMDELRQMYIYRDPLSESAAEVSDRIRHTDSVAVHVRRGDYVGMNYSIESPFYRNSMIEIDRRLNGRVSFFVFSEDLKWVQHAFSDLPFSIEYVDIRSSNKDLEEFELMRMCDHQIISRSTYSWWAAWLNDNENKMVFFPDDYLIQTSELWPDSWCPRPTKESRV